MEEIWKDVVGYEGLYLISNLGRVKSVARQCKTKDGKLRHVSERIRKQHVTNNGYYYVQLHNNGKRKKIKVYRMVAQAFIPNPNNYPQVNHKDEDKSNNTLSNLEWCTQYYNNHYNDGYARRMASKAKTLGGIN